MANIETLTLSSTLTYQNILKKFGYVKTSDRDKLVLLTYLYDIVFDSDFFYVLDEDTQLFVVDPLLLENTNIQLQQLSTCLMNHSCLINDSITENITVLPEDNGGTTPPDPENPLVEFTFNGGVTWYALDSIGVRSYEVIFAEIPNIDVCGWRFPVEYNLSDFKIFSNNSWTPEVYSGEESTTDRWAVTTDSTYKYYYWHEVNSQGRPGHIYSQVRYRFKLGT